MAVLTDLHIVRELLNRDREWAAYAIGDLAPGFLEHCEWHGTVASQRGDDGTPDALILVYRGFAVPIVFALGEAVVLRPLVAEITASDISLHIKPDAVAVFVERYAPVELRRMRRFTLRRERFTPACHTQAREILEADVRAVEALYDDGHRRGEGPTFFSPSMLAQGTFRGIWEDGALVAIAGTHLFSAELGVCAIGNVYTRSDRRGRGLAAAATSAVAAHALDRQVSTIVLNVSEGNATAQRVYERLGFQYYCDFLEGEAVRIIAP